MAGLTCSLFRDLGPKQKTLFAAFNLKHREHPGGFTLTLYTKMGRFGFNYSTTFNALDINFVQKTPGSDNYKHHLNILKTTPCPACSVMTYSVRTEGPYIIPPDSFDTTWHEHMNVLPEPPCACHLERMWALHVHRMWIPQPIRVGSRFTICSYHHAIMPFMNSDGSAQPSSAGHRHLHAFLRPLAQVSSSIERLRKGLGHPRSLLHPKEPLPLNSFTEFVIRHYPALRIVDPSAPLF